MGWADLPGTRGRPGISEREQVGRTVAEQHFGLWEIQSQSECVCLVMLASLETQRLLWPRSGVVAPLSFLQAPLLECTPPPRGPTLQAARPTPAGSIPEDARCNPGPNSDSSRWEGTGWG